VIVCEILNILDGYRLRDLGFRSAPAVPHPMEAMRHACVDRNGCLGDPDFVRAWREGDCGENRRPLCKECRQTGFTGLSLLSRRGRKPIAEKVLRHDAEFVELSYTLQRTIQDMGQKCMINMNNNIRYASC